jgi:hypothetical protein
MKNFKLWFKSAAVRAIKTFVQAFLALIPTGAAFMGQVDWGMALSAGALAAILSFATSIAGLPEVKDKTDTKEV